MAMLNNQRVVRHVSPCFRLSIGYPSVEKLHVLLRQLLQQLHRISPRQAPQAPQPPGVWHAPEKGVGRSKAHGAYCATSQVVCSACCFCCLFCWFVWRFSGLTESRRDSVHISKHLNQLKHSYSYFWYAAGCQLRFFGLVSWGRKKSKTSLRTKIWRTYLLNMFEPTKNQWVDCSWKTSAAGKTTH